MSPVGSPLLALNLLYPLYIDQLSIPTIGAEEMNEDTLDAREVLAEPSPPHAQKDYQDLVILKYMAQEFKSPCASSMNHARPPNPFCIIRKRGANTNTRSQCYGQ